MRIGMDVSAVRHGLTNGVAVYTARLAGALLSLPEPPELVVWFCARETAAAESVLEDLAVRGADVVRGPAPWRWSPDGGWWIPVRPPMDPLLAGVDVFHIGEFHLPAAPRAGTPPFVATVHDVTTMTHPRHHTLLNRWVHRRRLGWIRRHAARAIAVSESTARDLGANVGVDPDRVAVVHEARGHAADTPAAMISDPAAVRVRYGVGPRYILSVGAQEPRKNHARLVRAFETLGDDETELVLAGAPGWRSGDIELAIDRSPARDRIRRLGTVPTHDLTALYRGATVFAYPSLYEGFGLPVLEAMAAGTPVLTSDVSSLPEVAGDAALLVDPGSVNAIREGLARLLAHPAMRARLADAGRERERSFTWRRAAEETMAVYRGALGVGRR